MATAAPECSIEGCRKPRRNRSVDWCNAHWMRWYRHGNPLGGRTANGEPMRFYEETVCNYDGDECLTWPFAKSRGHARLQRNGRIHIVSRLICERVEGPAPTQAHEAAHSCGKGHLGCVNPRHLSWKTRAENEADKVAHGTHLFGEKHPSAVLADSDVEEIDALKGRLSQRAIGARFGISHSMVWKIHSNKSRAASLQGEGK